MRRRVVVTGMGAVTPIGNNLGAYWEGLCAGVSGACPITHFDASRFKTRFACEVKNFDASHVIDKKDLRKMDLFTQYAIVAADEAIKHSGLDLKAIDLEKAGVIWSSGIGGINTLISEITDYVKGDGTPRFSPFLIPKMIIDIAAGLISMRYGFMGPNYAPVSACASSSNAMIDALTYIRNGQADIFAVGGSEASINVAGIGGFNAMKALSERNDSYLTASRPFDKDRDGFVAGEGAGCLIFEEYEHAVKRGAHIYAEVAGGGMSADAYHMTAPHPEGAGIKIVMRNALADAGLKPEDIDYVNVHGTSTPLGDGAELKAITSIFNDHAYKINISATKSMTGHLLGAAGAIEGIAAVLAIQHGIIPPTINLENIDPEIDPRLNLTPNKAQYRTVNAALSNTFGFGGHNASVIFKKIS